MHTRQVSSREPHFSPSHKRECELSCIEAMVQMVVKEPMFHHMINWHQLLADPLGAYNVPRLMI